MYFNTNNRHMPSLICSSINDNFTVSADNGNGKLTYPVGMITIDEIAYAGGKKWQTNTSYYLYNNTNYWTMSPSHIAYSYVSESVLYSTGYFGTNGISGFSHTLRPVISLKKGTILSNGNGTSTSPYIVE